MKSDKGVDKKLENLVRRKFEELSDQKLRK
jgi:hypothetical protein